MGRRLIRAGPGPHISTSAPSSMTRSGGMREKLGRPCRLTKYLKDRFNGDAGEHFLPMREAMRALGVSRQIVLQRVKRGELAVGHAVTTVYMFCCIPFGLAALLMFRFVRITLASRR